MSEATRGFLPGVHLEEDVVALLAKIKKADKNRRRRVAQAAAAERLLERQQIAAVLSWN